MTNQPRNGDTLREGVRTAIGILAALRDEIEQQIQDLRQRNDFSAEGARDAVKRSMDRAQQTFDQVRERLDFVPRREFEELRAQVAELRRTVDGMRMPISPPEIPAELE